MASAQTSSAGPFLVAVDAPDGVIYNSFTFTGVAVDCSNGQAATRISVYDGPDSSTTPIATGNVDASRSVASHCPNLPNNGPVNAGFNIVVDGRAISDGRHTLTFVAQFPSGDMAATNVVAVAANRDYAYGRDFGYGYGPSYGAGYDRGFNPMYDAYWGGYATGGYGGTYGPIGGYYGGLGGYYGGLGGGYGGCGHYGGCGGYGSYYNHPSYIQQYCTGGFYYPGQRADAPRFGCVPYTLAGFSSHYGYPQGFPQDIYVACSLCTGFPRYTR
jgi:hypothetical protein